MRILHLSDVHFGIIPARTDEATGRTVPPAPAHLWTIGDQLTPKPEALADILKRDLDNSPPDIVAVSGDVGWSGVADDYEPAHQFFRLLTHHWPDTRIVIAPGNHDVNRSIPPEDNPQTAYIDFLKEVYSSSFASRFPLLHTHTDARSQRHRLINFEYIAGDILVVAANSAAELTTEGVPVFIDPAILPEIDHQMTVMGVTDDTLKLLMVHHHLFPFAEPPWGPRIVAGKLPDRPDPTLISNSAKIQEWLTDNGFHMVLHGHKHLAHGRRDVLWRSEGSHEGSRLFVVGAGSAGVHTDERGMAEHLTYNVLDITRFARYRWNVEVSVRRINHNKAIEDATEDHHYRSFVGSPIPTRPWTFWAERMDDCHRSIASSLANRGTVYNFMSIVEDTKYRHPTTAMYKGRSPTEEEVRNSFFSLHPEYDARSGWNNDQQVFSTVAQLSRRFQFRHGPRLFGVLGRPGEQPEFGGDRSLRPIIHAIQSLAVSETRAYAGLYRPDVDIAMEDEPFPGLTSVQLVPRDGCLDIIATFRKIELSYWWCVNMMEMVSLLEWAVRKHRALNPNSKRFKGGRVIFFAAIAQWRGDDPEATYACKIDSYSLKALTDLVMKIDAGDEEARRELATVLNEKQQWTNESNIVEIGLMNLADLLEGVVSSRSSKGRRGKASALSPLSKEIRSALQEMNRAIDDREAAELAVQEARAHLERAVEVLAAGRVS